MTINDMTFKGTLLEQEPMSRHTSWRVGGLADYFYRPTDLNDLSLYLRSLNKDESVFF